MPKISFENLATTPIVDALQDWARSLPADQKRTLIDTALHESAHIITSFAVNAGCYGVTIRPSPDRSGRLGRALCGAAVHAEEEAFCSAAGVAWEERPGGHILSARQDEEEGKRFTYNTGHWPYILDCARAYVQEHEGLIRVCATGLLSMLPRSCTVSRSKDSKFYAWLRPQVVRMPLSTLQAVPNQKIWDLSRPPQAPVIGTCTGGIGALLAEIDALLERTATPIQSGLRRHMSPA